MKLKTSVKKTKMVRISLGIGLTLLVLGAGYASTLIFPIEQLLWERKLEREQRKAMCNFIMQFDLHDFDEPKNNITGLYISYYQNNSKYLNHSSSLLSGIAFNRDIAYKLHNNENYNCSIITSDSYWRVSPRQLYLVEGEEREIYRSLGSYLNESDHVIIEDDYVGYEITLFESEISKALLECTNITNLEVEFPNAFTDSDYENEICEFTLSYNYNTTYGIELFERGYIRITELSLVDPEISDLNSEIYKCEESEIEIYRYTSWEIIRSTYKRLGSEFDNFHSIFSEYANSHIFYPKAE
ncbi:hypothetical protein [Candidatus Lokiarchaeum ossiferum]|uniref:hypothetical protein n=1 Tax=Candidatus Lokiarchaeum ossiferum TaxID=2951803 RepID=UPI00352F1982